MKEKSLGQWLRELRQARGLPLRVVAASAEIDTTLLSKVELGQRLPTEKQTSALAKFFDVSTEDMVAKRIEERFWLDHRDNPAAHKAAVLIGKLRASQFQTHQPKARRKGAPVQASSRQRRQETSGDAE